MNGIKSITIMNNNIKSIENKQTKIRCKMNRDENDIGYYIFVVDIECLTEQKSFTNETGTFYIKSFLPIKNELYDYECELYTIEEYRNIQLEKLLK